MKRVEAIADLRAALDAERAGGRRVGFVPTMGYLHDGHASLVRAARAATDVVAVSIFVNPLQFGAGEDLSAYPRDLGRDSRLAEANGADLLFTPSVEEMYPLPVQTTVSVGGVSEPLEGASRPTHFAGVATVVAKLFSIVGAVPRRSSARRTSSSWRSCGGWPPTCRCPSTWSAARPGASPTAWRCRRATST